MQALIRIFFPDPVPPPTSSPDYAAGRRHLDNERYADAYACFQRVLPSHIEYADAQFEIGCLRLIRNEQSSDFFKRAADLGHIDALIHVGLGHLGMDVHSEKGLRCLETAAYNSSYAAMYVAKYHLEVIAKDELGLPPTTSYSGRYSPTISYSERDLDKGIYYLRWAVGLRSAEGIYQLYLYASSANREWTEYNTTNSKRILSNFEEISALDWLKKAAEAGHAKALYELGLKERDAAQALKYFEEAAERGSIEALKWLEAHKPADYKTHRKHIEAFSEKYELFYLDEHLALRGDPEALMKMAGRHWLGIDCKRDRGKALEYIDRLGRIDPVRANKFRSYCHWKEGDLTLAKKMFNQEEKDNRE